MSNEMKMGTKEISAITKKSHSDVKRLIKRLADQGIVTFTQIEQKSTRGRPLTEWSSPRSAATACTSRARSTRKAKRVFPSGEVSMPL
ncbi:hypothetical protein [Caballeronia sp. INDeC2]|uniref:hypothetical protein n=1 Tax=Caballeronia sp. INDeC2 TaxID=2921747 RepID=UPI00202826AB|nr:hypothetical protein [Caballeronia sp. INDeC2]